MNYINHITMLHPTYIRDADDFNLYDMQDRQIQKKEINCLMWVNDFIKIFENQSDEKLQQHIHRFAECLLPLDVDIINTNIDSFIDIMMKCLYGLYQIDYTDSSIIYAIIREDDKYQVMFYRLGEVVLLQKTTL